MNFLLSVNVQHESLIFIDLFFIVKIGLYIAGIRQIWLFAVRPTGMNKTRIAYRIENFAAIVAIKLRK